MKRMTSGGGWPAIKYTFRQMNRVGWVRLAKAMFAKNACKTCAVGMGGQKGGMVNEAGSFPEFCKKSLQAMVADMQGGITADFFARYSIAQLAALSPRELEWCGRLTQPLLAEPGDTHFKPVPWDAALDLVGGALKGSRPDENFFYASGRSSSEAGFLFQLFARLFGTNYVNNCSYYCHQASGVGLTQATGSGTASVSLEDFEHADCVFLIGGNPPSNHPRLMTTLMHVRRKGGTVVVVNPVREIGLVKFRVPSDPRSLLFGTEIASIYVQPHCGGDIAFLTGVAKSVIARGAVDHDFVKHHSNGYEAFAERVAATTWAEIEAGSGVDRATIERVADAYCKSRRTVFGWTMGITHHAHGVENVRAICNLAFLRGMAGKPGAGLMPIRGHSNVQAMGTVGVVPQLKAEMVERIEAKLGVKLPTQPGLDTMGCTVEAQAGRMKHAICLGGNFLGASPDTTFTAEALAKLDLVVYLNTSLNTGLVGGLAKRTLILPVCARDEEPDGSVQESMFNYVRFSVGGPPRLEGPRTEVAILAAIGERVLGRHGPVDWAAVQTNRTIRPLLADLVPGMEAVRDIDATKREFSVPNRVKHTPTFNTPDGHANFAAVSLPTLAGEGDELRMMTVRSEGQFNTVVYEDDDIYRGQSRRNVILMNAADIAARGLTVDQVVTVSSAAGTMPDIIVRDYDIRAGNCLMYYPEANVLVPTGVDPQSKTPAFKAVPVTVAAVAASRRQPLGVV